MSDIFETLLPDLHRDSAWNITVLDHKCDNCGRHMVQVHAYLRLDELYEVCSPECAKQLPEVVARSLRS